MLLTLSIMQSWHQYLLIIGSWSKFELEAFKNVRKVVYGVIWEYYSCTMKLIKFKVNIYDPDLKISNIINNSYHNLTLQLNKQDLYFQRTWKTFKLKRKTESIKLFISMQL